MEASLAKRTAYGPPKPCCATRGHRIHEKTPKCPPVAMRKMSIEWLSPARKWQPLSEVGLQSWRGAQRIALAGSHFQVLSDCSKYKMRLWVELQPRNRQRWGSILC